MTKLCETESHACLMCKIIYSLNCQYFNSEKTFVRTTEVKQCVLITKLFVKITKIAMYFLFCTVFP